MPSCLLTVPVDGIWNDPHNGNPVYTAVIRGCSIEDAILHVLIKINDAHYKVDYVSFGACVRIPMDKFFAKSGL